MKADRIKLYLTSYLITTYTMIAIILGFLDVYNANSFTPGVLIAFISILLALIGAAFIWVKKKWIVWLFVGIMMITWFIVLHKAMIGGFIAFTNRVIETYAVHFNADLYYLDEPEDIMVIADENMMIYFIMSLIGVLSLRSIQKNTFLIFIFDVLLFAIAIPAVVGLSPSAFLVIMLIAATLAISILVAASAICSSDSDKMRVLPHKPAIYIILILTLAGNILTTVIPEKDYKRPEFFTEFKEQVMDFVKKMFEGNDDTEKLTQKMVGNGYLGQIDELKFDYEPDFAVCLDAMPADSIYAGCFYSKDYEYNRWKRINGFDLVVGDDDIRRIVDCNPIGYYAIYSNVTFNKYRYIPVEGGADFSWIPVPNNVMDLTSSMNDALSSSFTDFDTQLASLRSDTKNIYRFDSVPICKENTDYYYPIITPEESIRIYDNILAEADELQYELYGNHFYDPELFMANTKYSSISGYEQSYRYFVNANYMSVNVPCADALRDIVHSNLFEGEVLSGNSNRLEMAYMIQNYLAENCTYTLKPGKLPEGKEFVEYFLFESKEGYCTYFATAGVMLLRAAGVPARYVEGYRFNPYEQTPCLDASVTNGERAVYVLDSSAHAWVQIYLDGIGWVDMEMTPGSSGSPSQIQTQSVTNPQETTQTPTTTQNPTSTAKEPETQVVTSTGTPAPVDKNPLISKEILRIVIIVVAAILLILLIAFIIFIRYRKVVIRQQNIYNAKGGTSNRRSVILSYERIARLLKYCGFVRGESESYADFALRAAQMLISEDEIGELTMLYEKAAFSEDAIDESEALRAKDIADAVIKRYGDGRKGLSTIADVYFRHIL